MTPYPLAWPQNMPRSKNREAGQFRTTLTGAMANVRDSLRRFAADSGKPIADLVISSNVTLGQEKPADPGVAIWFKWDGLSVSIPVDRYQSVAALQAIHHIVEARRTELRHGTLSLVRATFTGFAALAAPGGVVRPWREVLKFGDGTFSASAVEERFKVLAKEAHPDRGGSNEAMADLNQARKEALAEIGEGK